MIRINITSVLVDDQAKALAFYTDVLGFRLKHDLPLGEHRWLTVVSAADPDGVELLLEPDDHPAARAYMQALVADGIPITSFAVADVQAAYEELRSRREGRTKLHSLSTAPLRSVLERWPLPEEEQS